MTWRYRAATLALVLASTGLSKAASYAVVPLGTLGGDWSAGFGLSEDGAVVGASALPAGTPWAFSAWGGAITRLEAPPGATTARARGINSGGLVAGTSWVGGVPRATLWRDGSAELIGPAGASYATAVNEIGRVAGNYVTASGQGRAFLYAPDGWVDIGAQWGVAWSAAYALNDSGAVVGYGEISPGVFRAFVYSPDGTVTVFGTFGGRSSYAFAVNERGDVAGHASLPGGRTHAFLYRDGVMIDLGTLGGGSSFAYGINDAGDVVGWSWTASARRRAFLYRDGRLLDLNDLITPSAGWELAEAYAINNRGQITGAGYWRGRRMAFLLDPPGEASGLRPTENPEPSTWILVAAGLGLLVLGRGRRRARRPRNDNGSQPLE